MLSKYEGNCYSFLDDRKSSYCNVWSWFGPSLCLSISNIWYGNSATSSPSRHMEKGENVYWRIASMKLWQYNLFSHFISLIHGACDVGPCLFLKTVSVFWGCGHYRRIIHFIQAHLSNYFTFRRIIWMCSQATVTQPLKVLMPVLHLCLIAVWKGSTGSC